MLCIRLFAGDQTVRDPAILRSIDATIHELAAQTLATAPTERPSLAQWRRTLAAASLAARHATAAPRSPAAPAAQTRPVTAVPAKVSGTASASPRSPAIGARRRVRRLMLPVVVAAVLLFGVPNLSSVATWWRDMGRTDTTSVNTSPAEQAKQVADLLAVSGRDRKRVVSAIENTIACRKLPAAADALGRAADGRQAALDRARTLRTDQLPNGAELTEQMILAFRHSKEADDAYQRWTSAVSSAGCRSPAMRGKDRARGDSESAAARAAKKRIAKLWNPIAESYGHPTVSHLTI